MERPRARVRPCPQVLLLLHDKTFSPAEFGDALQVVHKVTGLEPDDARSQGLVVALKQGTGALDLELDREELAPEVKKDQ